MDSICDFWNKFFGPDSPVTDETFEKMDQDLKLMNEEFEHPELYRDLTLRDEEIENRDAVDVDSY